jgi:hypothetical protein
MQPTESIEHPTNCQCPVIHIFHRPDLFIDGVPCCDQYLAHTLAHEGLIAPARRGAVGTLVPAALTATGQAALAPAPAAA